MRISFWPSQSGTFKSSKQHELMNWHYVEQRQQVGPVTDAQLAQLFRAGTVNADTLVWRDGLPDWIPFREAKLEPNPPLTDAPPPLAPATAPNADEVVCAGCGKIFPAAETIRYRNAYVCAACKPVFLQKLSEGAKVDTGELDYAGFGIRFAAKFVDGLILGIPFMVVFVVAMMPMIRENAQTNKPDPFQGIQFLPMLVQVGFIFVQLAYQIFFLGKYGATPGKMLCKIKVVTPEGGRFGYGRAAGRAFAEMISGMACYIGYLLVLFDKPQRRALHDHICNTRVIYK
jgi:uncharacterized RDD family membrane protein YckC/DNA-directed RNA polymerase subunit RPC12/RpoP